MTTTNPNELLPTTSFDEIGSDEVVQDTCEAKEIVSTPEKQKERRR